MRDEAIFKRHAEKNQEYKLFSFLFFKILKTNTVKPASTHKKIL